MPQAPGTLAERLRRSWEAHDITALTDLFDDEMQYIIEGKVRFSSKKQLRNYWCKNKLRQKDPYVSFSENDTVDGKQSVYFTASFFHPVRLSQTVVIGRMLLTPTDDGSRIKILDETYKKIERFNPAYSFVLFGELLFRPFFTWMASVFAPLQEFGRFIGKHGLSIVFFIGILSVAYVNFLHSHLHWISDDSVNELKSGTLYWFALAYMIQQALPFLKEKVAPDLDVRGFSKENQDLAYMASEMARADSVQILSGDFSFIDTDKTLEACLRTLAFSRKLKLISYKSREIVEEEMAAKTSSNDILLKLKDENLIFFDFPVHAKISLIEHGGMKKMLFRFHKDIRGKSKLHMGFIKPNDNTRPLLDLVSRMLTTAK